jgi:hypothetical protein
MWWLPEIRIYSLRFTNYGLWTAACLTVVAAVMYIITALYKYHLFSFSGSHLCLNSLY